MRLATVLVVEDQRQICEMLAAVLENEGFSVLTASDASEALRIAHSRPGRLDLLLSDLDLPGMSGALLAQQLRAESPGLPVILMSGGWDPAVLGVSTPACFLPKPFSMANLARMAHAMVDG